MAVDDGTKHLASSLLISQQTALVTDTLKAAIERALCEKPDDLHDLCAELAKRIVRGVAGAIDLERRAAIGNAADRRKSATIANARRKSQW